MRISPRSRVGFALADEDLLGRFGLAEAHQGVHKPCPRRRGERVLRGQVPGQLLGGPERGQRIGVPAARQLDSPADVVDRQRRHGLSFRSDGALDASPPGLCLLGPPLPGRHVRENRIGVAGDRLIGPALPFGQLDRLPATLRCPCERSEELDSRLVDQAAELKERPADPARQRDALFQVPLRVVETGRPELGDAQADQRQ
jgi:hypothetical protein